MDWARFSAEYATLTVMSGAERNLALATLAEQDGRLSDLLRNQLEREDTAEFMATSAPGSLHTCPDLLASGARIGAWRIERVLGTGGMGAVYRVTRDDGTFEQTAALKTLRRTGDALSLRFENERRRLAMLEHPNIARIIDGGADDDGQPFMVVELVEGEPIDQWTSGKSRTEKLRLLRQLCSALAHAHARLVLHRDIKPGNVLVNEEGEVRLIDFGIAELAHDESVSGPGPLTFAVAAPEQLEGGQITTATDIFQVGMVAHRLLVGTWPARQSDGGVTIDAGKVRDPDLRAILTRATATDPAQRYDSMDALGEDYTNFADGSPVAAREGGALYRVRKFVGRYKVASGLAVIAAISMLGGTGISLLQTQRATQAREEAEFNLQQAEWAAEISRQQSAFSSVRNDILERAFGTPENQGTIATYMTNYWDRAKEAVAQDPDYVATVANVVGNYFLFRNDYPRASDILLFAEERGIGTRLTIQSRQGMLGRIYLTTGPRERAEHFLRLSNKAYSESLDKYSADHGASAMQLAAMTLEPADLQEAIKVVDEVFKNGNFKSAPPGYFESQVAIMHRYVGDFAKSRSWFERAFKAYDGDPKATLTGSDTMTMNYLGHLLFLSRDRAKAAIFLDRLAEIDRQKGPSNTRGDYAQLQAVQLIHQGRFEEAVGKIDNAETLFVEYAGADSIDDWALQPLKARALLLAGQSAASRETERRVAQAPDMVQESRGIRLSRVLLKQQRLASGQRRLSDFDGDAKRMLCINLQDLVWFEELFGSRGLAALPCADAIAAERARVN